MRPLPCQGSIATRRSVHTPSLRAASLFFVTNPILCFGLPPLRLFRFRFRFSRLIVFREIPVALCRIGIVPVHACRPIHNRLEVKTDVLEPLPQVLGSSGLVELSLWPASLLE